MLPPSIIKGAVVFDNRGYFLGGFAGKIPALDCYRAIVDQCAVPCADGSDLAGGAFDYQFAAFLNGDGVGCPALDSHVPWPKIQRDPLPFCYYKRGFPVAAQNDLFARRVGGSSWQCQDSGQDDQCHCAQFDQVHADFHTVSSLSNIYSR